MSLRLKLALAFGLLGAVVAIAIGTLSYRITHDALFQELHTSLESAWNGAARFTERRPPNDAPPAGRLRSGGMLALDLGVVGQIFSAKGVLLSDSTDRTLTFDKSIIDRGRTAASPEEYSDLPARTDTVPDPPEYRVRIGTLSSGRILLIAKPMGEISRALRNLQRRILFYGLLVTVLGAAAGAVLSASMTRKLRSLEHAAKHVAKTGDLSTQISTSGRDETSSVARSFQHMLAALRQSKDQQHQLIQDAGHELRTPLTSVRTNVFALRTADNMPPETRDRILSDLESETAELSNLINEVVELATDSRGEEPFEEVSLVDIADSVIARTQPGTERRIARTVSSVARDNSLVRAQRSALERAVRNLVENALKFDTSGGPVDIDVRSNGIAVLDRGPGIAPADQPHVFNRFYRGTEARSQAGSGLGLAIVADIVERNGGTCSVRVRDGGGCEIGFNLSQTTSDR
ncbi:MAG: HAMP domain-containing sensor histidine kinase [Acidimicrobiia bacterium]